MPRSCFPSLFGLYLGTTHFFSNEAGRLLFLTVPLRGDTECNPVAVRGTLVALRVNNS